MKNYTNIAIMLKEFPAATRISSFFFIFLLLSSTLFTPSHVSGTNLSPGDQRYISIDFNNVDIRIFIKYISELTGKNFVIDKNVQDNITIVSPTKISEEEAYRVFESVLDVHGYTTVPSGSVTKIIPAAKARSQNVTTLDKPITAVFDDKVITQIVSLKHTTPEDMKKVLSPLISKSSVMVAHSHSKMLIITETRSNIQRLLTIVETLDVEKTREHMIVVTLENADAAAIANILNTIYHKGSAQKVSKPAATVRIVPYERVNSMVILASQEELLKIERLITLLDKPAQINDGNIHVIYLQHANAIELAKVLNEIPQQDTEESANLKKAPSISKNVKITADEETNSLIITASRDEFTVLEKVITSLDIPRQMVYLEALIMEVNTTKKFDVGVEWVAGGLFDNDQGVIVSGFSGNEKATFGSVGGINAKSPKLSEGFSLGILKQGIEIGGVTFPNISAILNAYQNDSDINIIATPQILTTDNKMAEISVGENVPYITSKNTTASEQDYTQYEYKDVATRLSITPQINQAETMRLDIETEIVKLSGNSQELTPTTFKRTASTSVILNNKDTVVIGGIIGQDATLSEHKVPLLGDIPFLGWLFKTRSTKTIKTNMFIFITPKIIRNPVDIVNVTDRKEKEVGNMLPGVKTDLKTKLSKNHAQMFFDSGFEKLQANQLDKASDYFEAALENDPQNPYALLYLGIVYEKTGNFTDAINYYNQVLTSESNISLLNIFDGKKRTLAETARENIEKLTQQARQ